MKILFIGDIVGKASRNKINHRFISVAYAYEEQKLDYIPIDKFDFKVDYVITEKNLYCFQ